MQTTLNKIRKHHPCSAGWQTLLNGLSKTRADDEPLLLSRILEINGLKDTLWAFRAVEGYAREMRLFAVWCARQVAHLSGDPRVTQALDVAARYANGEASDAELREARIDAYAYAYAARAAYAYAYAAAYAAADADAYAYAATDAATYAYAAAADADAADARTDACAAQAAELKRALSEIEAGRDPYPRTHEGA